MTNELSMPELHYPPQYVEINGSKMHYIEQGSGNPILFLHGIPTSSYIWRHIIPSLSPLGRCIAPDLIGMGQSDKPTIQYTLQDHIAYIDSFIEKLNLKNITFVMHGWGSIIGFDYAMRHPERCKGLAFYEAYLRPYHPADISLPYQEQLNELQTLKLDGISFVDKVIAQSTLRALSDDAMTKYRAPFSTNNATQPLQQYLNELPSNNPGINELIAAYSVKLTQSNLPKLMLYSIPGFMTTMATLMWAKDNLPHLEIIDAGEDLHYALETHPTFIGQMISVWLQSIEQGK